MYDAENVEFKFSRLRRHLKAFNVCLGLHIVVMIAVIYISQEIFVSDVLTALKSYLKPSRKYDLRSLQLYGD